MTDKRAGTIMMKLANHVTISQLNQVRKSMSYSYFLRTGKTKSNWGRVNSVYKKVTHPDWPRPDDIPKKDSNLPTRIPSMSELKEAFTKEWEVACGMPLTRWSVALLASWDWAISGCRSGKDGGLSRIKQSTNHEINEKEGYCWTQFKRGRPKLADGKKRPWKAWRLCMCPGEHRGPPEEELRRPQRWVGGNPPDSCYGENGKLKWCTTCPVSALQLILGLQADVQPKKKHCYRRWLMGENHNFAKDNEGDVTKLCNEWFKDTQQANKGTFYNSHSGRKSLARWCSVLQVPYAESFEVHGDLYKNWQESYQNDADNDANFKRRTQTELPEVALKAYKRLREQWGIKNMKMKLTRDQAISLMYSLTKNGHLSLKFHNYTILLHLNTHTFG